MKPTRDLKYCPTCRETWPVPQITMSKQQIVMFACPKCGGEPKTVGRCE